MPVFLHALGLRNYRGIGADYQLLPAFKTFNFFIGANNAGKSTILNFISRHLPMRREGRHAKAQIEQLERHAGGGPIGLALGVPETRFGDAVVERIEKPRRQRLEPVVRKLCSQLADSGTVWLGTDEPFTDRPGYLNPRPPPELREVVEQHDWQNLWTHLTGMTGGSPDNWISGTLKKALEVQDLALPETKLIPAIRQIGAAGETFGDYSGNGLIDRLAELQSPDHDHRDDRRLFDKINVFLQTVTGRPDAEIEIPHNRQHVLVHMDGKVLPLSSLGTGIQEVIMIAAFCTISKRQIVCIEEPELHLHPLLQRKLVRYLQDNTDNQYFIATHSASFIDTPGAAIFHVKLEDGKTRITEAVLRNERFSICVDLGHRASDIVQANAIIWVEGPSDRIYLNHWISSLDPNLVEGIHYSIMFYGGRLLSHLSADDAEVTEFIALRSLNRNLAIVIDSDRTSPHKRINATKERLVREFQTHGGIAWVTKGREIENYVDHRKLQAAVKELYGHAYAAPASGGQYDHALHFERAAPKRRRGAASSGDLVETDVDKVKVARIVCRSPADLNILDLRERIDGIVKLIRNANA